MFRTFLKKIKRKIRDIDSQIRAECSGWQRHLYNLERMGLADNLEVREIKREFFDLHDKLCDERLYLLKILYAMGEDESSSDSDESGSDSSDSDDE